MSTFARTDICRHRRNQTDMSETIVNENDILMLEKLNEDADDEEEPPPPSDNEDDMIDSDDETDRERGYNSDDSYGF